MSRTKGDTHPKKLTKEVCEAICDGLRKGNYVTTCCRAVGISTATYYLWKRKGEKGLEPYKTFLDKVSENEAIGEMLHLEIIHDNALSGNWLSSAWLLERKYPQRFGKREQMALQTDNDFKLEISTAKSPYEMGLEEKRLLEEDRKDE